MVGEFDENSYEFFNENYDYKVKAFREKFFKSLDEPVSKKKVQRTLAELIYTQLIDNMNENTDDKIPKLYRENQLRWCSLMLRSQKMQQFFVQFTE